MNTSTVTLGTLIDRALLELEAASERGKPVVLAGAISDSAASMTLSTGDLNVTDLVEFGSEMMLVTSKSSDADPVYGISRGYYSTTSTAHSASAVGIVNPQFTRRRVAEAVQRSLTRIEAMGVTLVKATQATREAGLQRVVLPADCRQVLQVLYLGGQLGRVLELPQWQEYSTTTSAGRLLEIADWIYDTDQLEIIYRAAMSWTGTPPDETATVELPEPAVDLPSSYAAAWLVSGREVSRGEIDRANEYSEQDMTRVQSGAGLVRSKWQEFYRSVDEARRLTAFETPRHRPLVKRPRVDLRVGVS